MAKAKAVKLLAKGAKKLYKYSKNALKQGKKQGPKTRPQQATANASAKIADKAKAVGLGVKAFKKKFASVVAGEGKRATNAINKQVAAVNKGKPALKAHYITVILYGLIIISPIQTEHAKIKPPAPNIAKKLWLAIGASLKLQKTS